MPHSRTFRVLFVGSLLAAMAGMVALSGWLLWPEWQEFQERRAFERELAKLQAGLTGDETYDRFTQDDIAVWWPYTEADGTPILIIPYYRRSAWYGVYLKLTPTTTGAADMHDVPSAQIKVFRIEVPSENYEPQTDIARRHVSIVKGMQVEGLLTRGTSSGPVEEPFDGEQARRVAFYWDFYETITGRAKQLPGIRYEVIHTDPREATGAIEWRGKATGFVSQHRLPCVASVSQFVLRAE